MYSKMLFHNSYFHNLPTSFQETLGNLYLFAQDTNHEFKLYPRQQWCVSHSHTLYNIWEGLNWENGFNRYSLDCLSTLGKCTTEAGMNTDPSFTHFFKPWYHNQYLTFCCNNPKEQHNNWVLIWMWVPILYAKYFYFRSQLILLGQKNPSQTSHWPGRLH